jgi:hypothetical protein
LKRFNETLVYSNETAVKKHGRHLTLPPCCLFKTTRPLLPPTSMDLNYLTIFF